MKSTILALCLLISVSANAAEINFLDNPKWETVLEKAKKEDKIIFLYAYETVCGPCDDMFEKTYKDEKAANFYNANFINVKYDMEKEGNKTLAYKYQLWSFPNLIFIIPNGEILDRSFDFHEPGPLINLGIKAKNRLTEYYKLKENAITLNSVDFLQFILMAYEFKDFDPKNVANNYIAKQTNILGDSNLVSLVMNDIDELPNEKALAYFAESKDEILSKYSYTSEQFENKLIGFTWRYAVSEKAQTQKDINYDTVKLILDKYIPEKSFFYYHYYRIETFLENKETEKAIAEFDVLLLNTDKFDAELLYSAIINTASDLNKNGKLEYILKKYEGVKVSINNKGLVNSKALIKVIIYYNLNELEKLKAEVNYILSRKDTSDDDDIKYFASIYLKKALEKIN